MDKKRTTSDSPELDKIKALAKIVDEQAFIIREKERALQEANERAEQKDNKFRNLFVSMQEGVFLHEMIYDKKGRAINYKIIEANPISEAYLNINNEDAVGQVATALYGTSEAPFLDIYASVAETGEPVSFDQYFAPMDKYFHISVFSPQKGQFATVFTDITQVKKQEKELIKAKEEAEESELKYRSIFESSSIGIVIINPETAAFIEFNDQVCKQLGYTREEFSQLTIPDIELNETKEETMQRIKHVMDIGMADFETKQKAKHGEIKDIYVSARVIEISRKKLYHCIWRDITDSKKDELELIKAKENAEENNRLKTSFLQNMSHEIRTPLNAICGFSEFLNKPEFSKEKQDSFVAIIQNSSQQLLSIVSDVLTISSLETKQEKVNTATVCINHVLSNLLVIFKQQAINKNISFYVKPQLNDKQSEIYTDKTKIIQVLTNLLSNALKFTPEGFIEFGYNLKTDKASAELEFYVKDSGIGISQENHEKIFERFRQADLSTNIKYGGTGLGLAISKGFVELLGGKIWVQSVPAKGSVFYFTIPYLPVKEVN